MVDRPGFLEGTKMCLTSMSLPWPPCLSALVMNFCRGIKHDKCPSEPLVWVCVNLYLLSIGLL